MTVAATDAFVNALNEAVTRDTGCLYVADGSGLHSGRVYVAEGKVYAVHVGGFMPKIGHRLRTGGDLTNEQYEHLLSLVNGDVYAPEIGALAVQNDYIDPTVLEAVLRELLLSSVGAMCSWENLNTRFKKDATTDKFTIAAVSAGAITKAIDKRHARWNELWSQIAPGLVPEDTYPTRTTTPTEALSSEQDAVLLASSGSECVDDVAGLCGLTRFETGHVLDQLVRANLIVMQTTPQSPEPSPAPLLHHTPEAAIITEHGDSPVAFTDAVEPTSNLPDAVEQTEHDHPEVTSFTDPVTDDSTRDPNDVVTHFAPDVLDTLTANVDEDDEPSAFGSVEESFPDGMDLGSIPTETIAQDFAITDSAEHTYESPSAHAAAAAPLTFVDVAPPVTPVSELPHFSGPVAPVPSFAATEHAGHAALPTPPNVPTFVDASAFDRVQPAASEDTPGMPGVPLPPLPTFLPAPTPPAAPTYPVEDLGSVLPEPVSAPHDEDPVHGSDETTYTGTHVETLNETWVEPAPADESNSPEEPDSPDEQPQAPAIEQAPAPADLRHELARQRLLEEIDVVEEAVAAAQTAMTRADEDHAAHVISTDHTRETLTRYKTFLQEAEQDAAQAEEALATNRARTEEATTVNAEILEGAKSLADAESAAEERIERAQEALRAAEDELSAAQEAIQQIRAQEDEYRTVIDEATAQFAVIDAERETLQADLDDAQERTVAYTAELAETQEMLVSLEDALSDSARFKEAAEQRYTSVERQLVVKRERLANLG